MKLTPSTVPFALAGLVSLVFAGCATSEREDSAYPYYPPVTPQLLEMQAYDRTANTQAGLDTQFPFEIPVGPTRLGMTRFIPGDGIVVTTVRGTAPTFIPGGRYLVEGVFTLKSAPAARIGVSVASIGYVRTKTDPGQHAAVTYGIGHFQLEIPMQVAGYFHVSFYPTVVGESFGSMYFQDRREPFERKGEVTYQSNDDRDRDRRAEIPFNPTSAGNLPFRY